MAVLSLKSLYHNWLLILEYIRVLASFSMHVQHVINNIIMRNEMHMTNCTTHQSLLFVDFTFALCPPGSVCIYLVLTLNT